MPTHNQKDSYRHNYDADRRILRAEFVNAVAPALDRAMAELASKHTEIELAEEPARRLCSAFDEVRQLAIGGVRRWLTAEVESE